MRHTQVSYQLQYVIGPKAVPKLLRKASSSAKRIDDAKPDDAKPDDAKPDDTKPDDAKPDDAEPDDAKSEHAMAEKDVKPWLL